MKSIAIKNKVLLACLLSAFTLPAMADNFYIFGDVGQGKFSVDGGSDATYSKTDTSFSVGAGYDINKFLAVEVAYRDLGGLTDKGSDFNDDGDFEYSDKLNVTALQVSVIGKLPVSDVVNLYGRVGFADVDADYKTFEATSTGVRRDSGTDSKTRALLGVGASFDVSSQLALRAEYNQYAKWDDLKLSALTIGAVYKF